MAQPPAYNRSKDFAKDFGNETDHVALNTELDNASNSINDIRANLAILQADDGKLRPFVVTADSISEELRISLVEGVVMDAQAMLDESKAASEASEASAEKAGESEAASAASAVSAAASAEKAAGLAAHVQGKADEIVRTASAQAQTCAAEAAQSAQSAADSATQAQSVCELMDERAGEIVQTAASEARSHAQSAEESAVAAQVHAEIANQRGIPVGTVVMFSASTPPAGYLKCDGAAVGRDTYPDLFAAIGTTYGEGDGEATFNVPNREGYKRIDYSPETTTLIAPGDGYIFAQASTSLGGFYLRNTTKDMLSETLAEREWGLGTFVPCWKGDTITVRVWQATINLLYFASSNLQPFDGADKGCLCIKSFDAATKPGLIDVTELANEVAGKADKTQVANLAMPSGSPVPLTPSKGGTYTAPADGYFCFVHGPADNTGQLYIQLHNQTTGLRYQTSAASQSGDWNVGYLPVIRGQTLRLSYGIELSGDSLWFFYAQGSQP